MLSCIITIIRLTPRHRQQQSLGAHLSGAIHAAAVPGPLPPYSGLVWTLCIGRQCMIQHGLVVSIMMADERLLYCSQHGININDNPAPSAASCPWKPLPCFNSHGMSGYHVTQVQCFAGRLLLMLCTAYQPQVMRLSLSSSTAPAGSVQRRPPPHPAAPLPAAPPQRTRLRPGGRCRLR